MTTVLASAADERYGFHLLNLVGSVYVNARRTFDRIVLYDLGLSPFQRRLLRAVRGVEVRTVPPTVPRHGFVWKPWIWTHIDAEDVLWLDAGTSVLRRLEGVIGEIRERGCFLVGQGQPLEQIVPADYYELYGLSRDQGAREVVAAGIIGFTTSGSFFEQVIVPTYQDCAAGRSAGFSKSEAERHARGLQAVDRPIIRDSAAFRHDQTVLNLRIATAFPDAAVFDLWQFAGFRSPRDHPEQVIWNHRRRGDYRYLSRIPYRGTAAVTGRLWGLRFRWRFWFHANRWRFRPSLYVRKALSLLRRPG